MTAIFLIFIAGGILTMILLALKAKEKDRSYYRNERLFSDAWKRTDGQKIKSDNRYKLFRSPRKTVPGNYKDDGDDFLSDILLRTFKSRRDYYREVYLKSAAWQRKRFLVLKRDNWCCVHCGRNATQVHHKKYAKTIGKEPIEWLESVCKSCHDDLHW